MINIQSEIAAWNRQVVSWLGVDARLLYVSSYSTDIRIYQLGDRILKIRRLTPASVRGRPNSLEDEFVILRWLEYKRSILTVPKAIAYHWSEGWEVLELAWLIPPLTTDPVVCPKRETLRGLWSVAQAVWCLNRSGVSHGDLLPGNVGHNYAGKMVVLDFDQAVRGHWLRCFLRDFFGIPFSGRAAKFTFLDRMGRLSWISPVVRRVEARRLRARHRRAPNDELHEFRLRVETRSTPELIALFDAWKEAALSGANSPDSSVAYYSIDLDGIHFPGERPWSMRWSAIARTVDFRGKRVVELGCNMALLSIHARLSGAAAAIAADLNPKVLAAGFRASVAFGAEVMFHVVDFDEDAGWEDLLGKGDIVTALSLTYWLRDKARLWKYLSAFSEIIFEGHEPAEEVFALFASHGFSNVAVIGLSERKRNIYHAQRAG